MPRDGVADEVRDFFGTVGHAGLILPSGWFGRPYDNLLRLSRCEVSEGKLLIELDGQIHLVFAGDVRTAATDRGLKLVGFTSMAFDWTEFGSSRSHRQMFAEGDVEFVVNSV